MVKWRPAPFVRRARRGVQFIHPDSSLSTSGPAIGVGRRRRARFLGPSSSRSSSAAPAPSLRSTRSAPTRRRGRPSAPRRVKRSGAAAWPRKLL